MVSPSWPDLCPARYLRSKAFSTSAPFEMLKPPPHFKKNMMLLIRRYLSLNL
jgi:hypothetical protein